MNEVVEKSLSLTRNQAKVHSVEMRGELTPDLPPVSVRRISEMEGESWQRC